MSDAENKKPLLTAADGQTLLALARHSIAMKLGLELKKPDGDELLRRLEQAVFREHCGTFVTLKKGGTLRGCIGALGASESLEAGIRRNAVNAAFQDPRFAPLSAAEYEQIEIEVSVLTVPQPLPYRGADDLCRKLKPHQHGVVLRQGHASATFLPQVWEQLPTPEAFLSQLCLKAGLSASTWQREGLEILVYTVQHFEE